MNIATSGGATREAITKTIGKFKIIIPPINLQNEFAQKIEKIEELKSNVKKSGIL